MEDYFNSRNSVHYSSIQSAILQTHVRRLHSAMSHTRILLYRTSSGNLPTRIHILAVSKSPNTGERPASTLFGYKLSFLQSASFQTCQENPSSTVTTHVFLPIVTQSSNQQESVAKLTRASALCDFQKRTDYKSIEVRRQQSRDHRNVSVSIVACVTILQIGSPFELLRC
jgi:hypothetical protein